MLLAMMSAGLAGESGRRLIGGPGAELVAFDLEATGLAAAVDRVIEIGAIRFDAAGEILATFEQLVNPLRPSGSAALALHGISDESLLRAEPAAVVLPRFLDFLGESRTTTLLAHNAAFDAGLLGRELIRAGLPLPGHPVVDTLAWARRRWPRFGTHKLAALARRFGAEEETEHRALADSRRVRAVYLALREGEPPEDRPPLAYPVFDGAGPPPIPLGWEPVAEAVDRAEVVRFEYLGGTRGAIARDVSPARFAHRGGVAYLVARCHLDGKVKEFQVERIRNRRVLGRDG